MSYRIIAKTTGSVMLLQAACMIIMLCVSLLFKESIMPFLYSLLILIAVGFPLSRMSIKNDRFTAKCGYVTVAVIWFIFSLFGALPFYFSGHFASYVDCFFEAVSGFTTTGSSILTAVEPLPKSILLWRSTTQLLGGMGILVLVTAIVPALGDRSHHLMQAEVPGPTADKLVPKLTESAKILYTIYIVLVVMLIVLLIIVGIPVFDSINISFAALSTGGFSVTNASIAAYDNIAAEVIISIFMILGGINFSLYFLLLKRNFKAVLKNEELRLYLGIICVAILLNSVNIYGIYNNILTCLRYALFTVSTLITTTGFVNVDYNLWPAFSKMVFIIIMLIGSCAGSTAGGVKVSRFSMALKAIVREVRQIIHPNSVNIIRMDGKAVGEKTVTSVMRFFAAYFIIIFLSILLVSLDNYDMETNVSAVIACISNIGPGLSLVGPVSNFSFLSNFSKIVLSLDMLIGRLEIFPILIFFYPKTWKNN